eukprot:1901607-Rhodomonas_salina.1
MVGAVCLLCASVVLGVVRFDRKGVLGGLYLGYETAVRMNSVPLILVPRMVWRQTIRNAFVT